MINGDISKNSNLMSKLYTGIKFGAMLLWFGVGVGIAYSQLTQKPSSNSAIYSDLSAFRLEMKEAVAVAHDDNRKLIDGNGNRVTILETKWDEIDKRLTRIEDKIDKLK